MASAFFGVVVVVLTLTYFPPNPPRVLLFVSPVLRISEQPFYATFIQELAIEAKQSDFDVALALPTLDFTQASQLQALRGSAMRAGVVVFTPFGLEQSSEEDQLLDALHALGTERIILFDTDLPQRLKQRLLDSGLRIPACVKADDSRGGELAAKALINFLAGRPLSKPVIRALDSKPPSERVAAFERVVKKTLPFADFDRWTPDNQDRSHRDVARERWSVAPFG